VNTPPDTAHTTQLHVHLRGQRVQEGRIGVDELTALLKAIQLSVKRLGQVLTGEISGPKPGRLRGEVEDACSLDVIAFSRASFDVALEPRPQPVEQVLLSGALLGTAALETLVRGLGALATDDHRLLNEFDYGVLVTLREATRVLDRGVDTIDLDLRVDGRHTRVAVHSGVRARIIQNITGPMRSAMLITGVLREVNLERKTCQIFPLSGRFVLCSFDERHELVIRDALDARVEARGVATLRESDGQVREMRIEDVQVLEDAAEQTATVTDVSPKRLTAGELLTSPLVGMWRDRTDLGDSSELARRLRAELESPRDQ
jgi:hypothetical protein